ncbi:DNA-binding protein [Scheffersomyces coipomensis]|uniref:DNA-binding protein n=1 Tax=Scheffersomyces coipomensis TaxID=1788519 RepID=UPI00315D6C5B
MTSNGVNGNGDATSSSKLALKGSSKIVTDYFEYAINSILFQRGIYPIEDFITIRKYNLSLLVSNDPEVKTYIANIMLQIKKWIYGKRIAKLVVVIISKSTLENIERWEFNIDVLQDDNIGSGNDTPKSKDETQREIQSIIRQITSSVSYLPVLKEDDYSFNVLVYTDPNNPTNTIPIEWCDTNGDGRHIAGDNVDKVDFTSFSTNLHKVGTSVSYKLD